MMILPRQLIGQHLQPRSPDQYATFGAKLAETMHPMAVMQSLAN